MFNRPLERNDCCGGPMEEVERQAWSETEEIDLREYVRVLRRWLWLIALCSIIAAVSAYIISARFIQPVYKAEAILMVEPSARVFGSIRYQDVLAGERIARTYAEILESRPLLEKTLVKLGYLPDLPDDEVPFDVSVQAVRDTQLIKISVESEDPVLAAEAANALAQAFIEERAEDQTKRFGSLKSSIEEQLSEIDEEISRLEEQKNSTQDQEKARALEEQLVNLRDMRTRLLASLYEIQLAEAQNTELITQLEKADVPDKPVRPKKLLNTFIAGILGGMLAVMGAFLAEYLDTSIKEPEQIERLTGLPVLGSIFAFEANPDGTNLITLEHPRSHTAESFMVLRANLEFLSVDAPVRVLGVTSPGAGEGKSNIAANLALVMARGGRRVILVSADLRKPMLYKLMGLAQSPGLSEALVEKEILPEEYLQAFEVENLRVLTSGRLPPNPADLLASRRMGELINRFKNLCDVVIVDCPPLLAVADTVLLGRWMDGVLMVAEWGETDRSAFVEAVERARQGGLRVLGAVLNKVKPPARKYYYYYYYEDKGTGENKPWWKKPFKRRKRRRVKRARDLEQTPGVK